MREHVLVYDTGGGIKEVEVNQGIRRISGSNSLSTLESHLAEHAAILGTPYNLVSNEFIRVRDEGGGLREVPVTQGVRFIRSDSNKVTLDGHALEHAALAADTPLAVTSNEYVLVYNTGGGSRQVPVVDGCLFIEGERYLSTYSDHFNIHTTTGLPPGLDLPAIGRTLFAPLKSSLVLSEGTGSPTFTRATKAWGFNELGILEELPNGCAFFAGARLVFNSVRTTSEDFSNAIWVKSNCTVTGTNAVVCSNATSLQRISQETSGTSARAVVIGSAYRFSVRIRRVSGGAQFIQLTAVSGGFGAGQHANFSLVDGSVSAVGCTATSTLVAGTTDTYDLSIRCVATANGSFDIFNIIFINSMSDARTPAFIGDGVKSFEILRAWSVDVTGYDASYVPEYVSVGVESAPFFGAGVDGAKYYETDWQGAPIPAANLLGFKRESAATNNLLHCRDLSDAAWQQTGVSGAEILVNGSFAADTDWSKTAGWAIGSGQATCTANGSNQAISQAAGASYVSGKKYVLQYTVVSNTLNAGTLRVGGYSGSSGFGTSPTTIPSTVGLQAIAITGNPTGTGVTLDLWVNGAASGALVIDNVSIKLAAVQCSKTATGLDGIANTATTLTATASDAIILQPITLSSADRCASAYVKRRTGTGTISFTQDGGSSWTDITSQINSSTYSRVQITSTLANPSVGFKISTNGDAIDVDVVQNEAGSVATSPIITTTATVTRNADSLTYQTAGNIDLAVGTMFCELFSPAMSAFPPVFLIGTGSCSLITGEPTSWRFNDSTTTVTIASGLSSIKTGKRKRAASWGGATKSVCGDGIAPTSGAFDGSFGNGATIDIGNTLNGYIGPVAIYNYKMTDAELQAVTA